MRVRIATQQEQLKEIVMRRQESGRRRSPLNVMVLM